MIIIIIFQAAKYILLAVQTVEARPTVVLPLISKYWKSSSLHNG